MCIYWENILNGGWLTTEMLFLSVLSGCQDVAAGEYCYGWDIFSQNVK